MESNRNVCVALAAAAAFGWADNPIVQTNFTADPAPMVYKDTMFVYTGHDEDGSTYYTMNDWRIYSSTDMVNWTDRGSPLSYKTFSWAKGDAWAAQCVERNGKFYWYVTLSASAGGAPAIGVAVSSSPTGPFVDAIGKPLAGPSWAGYIDPTVFIDDDGQAYLYWGNPGLWYVRLNKDMVSYSGAIETVNLTTAGFGTRTGDAKRPTLYEEGPWFYKRGSLYYMVYAGGPISEHISYSTSPNPTGPWTYRGVVMPAQGGSFTNHSGIADFKGTSYFFYHNGALPNGGGFTRSVAVEPFAYNADGTIPKLSMTSLGVVKPAGNLDPYRRVEGETMAFSKGVRVGVDAKTGVYVSQIADGDHIKLRSVDFRTAGAASFEATVAGTGTGSIELRLDGLTGKLIGTLGVGPTGGTSTWKTLTTSVSGATGVHDLYLVFKGSGGTDLFHLDQWAFREVPTSVSPKEPNLAKGEHGLVDVRALDGSLVRAAVPRDQAVLGLRQGVYLLGDHAGRNLSRILVP